MARVFLAVGHGTNTAGVWDAGTVDGNYTEADLAFPIVGFAVPILRDAGVEVGTDWDTGNDRNMTYTVRDSNDMGADVYVSVHIDWNQASSGIYPLVASAEGEKLANCIKSAMEARMNINFRGIAYVDHYEVTATDAVACIFEEGGIRSDINSLVNEAPVRGASLAYGILDYLGIDYTSSTPSPVPPVSEPAGTPQVDGNSFLDVEERQYFLHICNYQPDLDIDGDEGPITLAGEKFAARSYMINWNGSWDAALDIRARGQMMEYQKRLTALGFYKGDLDGIGGPQTLQAVKDFQSSKGLDADGVIGPQTFPLLMN